MLDLMADLRELHVKGFGNRSMNHLHHFSGAGSKSRSVVKLRVVADDSNKALDIIDDDGSGDRNEQVSPPPVLVASSFPDLSSWHILKTVIMDGCGDLELIAHNSMPLSLESFTMISDVATKIKSISFRGCTKLKSLILRGLFHSLVELDMSGTSVKTLDLSATQAMGLKRVFLLGCEELRAILWPREEEKQVRLEVVRIDTTTATHAAREGKSSNKQQQEATTASDSSASIGGSSSATTVCGKEDPTLVDSDSYISIRDPRFFRSLLYLRHAKRLQVEISSTTATGRDKQQQVNVHCYKPAAGNMYVYDAIICTPATTSNGSSNSQQVDCDSIMDVSEMSSVMVMKSIWLWNCPPAPMDSVWANCYISLQDDDDETHTRLLLQGTSTITTTTKQLARAATTLPHFVSKKAKTLHLHDSLSITCLPGPAPAVETYLQWNTLEWCRLERCPNLEGAVFTAPQIWAGQQVSIFYYLQTFWASQLQKARYIWDWSALLPAVLPEYNSFEDLEFLHLDYCPRLVHVLPLYASNTHGCRSLETLEIVCCTDLREVFTSDPESQQQQQEQQATSREFPRLKRIHLYDLPKLQCICGYSRMLAPNLETLRIRGCWGLKRLPAIGRRRSTPPVVDCEDLWDSLEWDGEAAGHHPSHYETMHSAYYKKNMLRASVLR